MAEHIKVIKVVFLYWQDWSLAFLKFQDVLTAVSHGILDSLRGFILIFTLDREIELQRSLKRETKSKIVRRSHTNTSDASKEKQE